MLLLKLKSQYGINGTLVKFLVNYLKGRKQRVVIGGDESGFMPVNSGVSQGSIIGPLLFVLFINDMTDCVSEETKIALYADDTKTWREILSYKDHLILQSDINALLEWSLVSKMRFHPDKCKVMKVTLKTEKCMDKFHYRLGEAYLEYATAEKDLGIKITPRSNWGQQWDSIISSAMSRLGL